MGHSRRFWTGRRSLLFVSAPLVGRELFGKPAVVPLLRIAAVGVPFVTVGQVAVAIARGNLDAGVQAYVSQLFQPAMRLLLVVALLIAGFGVIGAVSGQVAAIGLAALAAIYLTRRSLPAYDVTPESMYRSVLVFSLPLIAVQGMGFLNSNVDVYMVGYFLASSELGIYNIALQLGNIVTAILGTAGFLLPPMLTRLHEQGKTVEMRRTYQVLTKWMVVLIMPIFVVLFFSPRLIIGTFFGTDYIPGVLALRILLAGKFFAIIMGLNAQALIALGDNKVVSYIALGETAVNVALNVALIPVVGIEGAAIGMAVSTVVGDLLGVAILYRRFGLHPFTSSVLSPVAALTVVASASYGLLWILGLPGFLTVAVVGILYLPVVAVFGLDPEDQELLATVEDRTGYDLDLVRRTVFALR
ncbi:oligosaccharide flippase family protein [Halapricum sp. CBA1109]|nr:oligosaccharide flippase family protein [Halapricum sp. CBA1109]